MVSPSLAACGKQACSSQLQTGRIHAVGSDFTPNWQLQSAESVVTPGCGNLSGSNPTLPAGSRCTYTLSNRFIKSPTICSSFRPSTY